MFQNFFVRRDEEHDHYTRSSGNLSVQYARTKRRFSLFCKDPIIWNEISSNICKVTMLVTFKKIWKALESIPYIAGVVGWTYYAHFFLFFLVINMAITWSLMNTLLSL